MKNLGFSDVITLITLVVAIFVLFKKLNKKRYLGKLLFKVSGDFNVRSSMFFWFLMGSLQLLFLILQLININQDNHKPSITALVSPVIWIILSIISILRIKYDKEIRENGIIIDQDYVYWLDIIKHEWIGEERLEITYFKPTLPIFKKGTSKVWVIEPEDKEEIDMIFNRYMN